ncbi:aldo/keto reductase [Luteimicrobium sp. NPDC057192]|uniref:aldo/keto reductase n=1 Tax=Luteimicrobium sp. NPDC057192 TaxID=3346042 RepID=UPI00363D04F2
MTRIGLGLAALGRPAYITLGRTDDLGARDAGARSVEALEARTHAMLDAAWDAGVRYVDAARSYGYAERFLGSWLAARPGRREELTIGSKWGYAYVGAWDVDAPVHEAKEHSLARFEAQWPETLDALGTRPDVYLVHSVTPDSPVLGDGALLDALGALAATGVRVGISTSGPAQGDVLDAARTLRGTPFSAVQATWNLLEPSAGAALARAHEDGWFVVVKEALANGRLTARGDVPGVGALAADDGQSVDAFAVGAAAAQPWADVVLSGAVTVEQLTSNLTARGPRVDGRAIAVLAEDPATYWAERAALPWG